jgi:hypothetical protein
MLRDDLKGNSGWRRVNSKRLNDHLHQQWMYVLAAPRLAAQARIGRRAGSRGLVRQLDPFAADTEACGCPELGVGLDASQLGALNQAVEQRRHLGAALRA